MSVENLKKMSNADLLLKQLKKVKKKKNDAEAGSKRIPEDLKKEIKNRKGVKFKEKLGKLIFKGSMSAGDPPMKSTDMKKKKINKNIDAMMELIKTPEFKNKSKA